MITRKPFYYLRHGQTDWNLSGRFQGQTNIPLNATGIAQANAAKTMLAPLDISRIYCSPLDRARQTADIANEVLQLDVQEIPDLRMCNFGELEGFQGNMDDHIAHWKQDKTPSGGEPYQDFRARVFAALNEALKPEGTPLIVAHGGVFWPIAEHMGFDTLSGEIPNAYPVLLTPSAKSKGWTMTLL